MYHIDSASVRTVFLAHMYVQFTAPVLSQDDIFFGGRGVLFQGWEVRGQYPSLKWQLSFLSWLQQYINT